MLDILATLLDRCVYHLLHLVDGEVSARTLVSLYLVSRSDLLERILFDVLSADSHIEGCTEYDAIAIGSGVVNWFASLAAILVSEEVDETKYKILVNLTEGDFVAFILNQDFLRYLLNY